MKKLLKSFLVFGILFAGVLVTGEQMFYFDKYNECETNHIKLNNILHDESFTPQQKAGAVQLYADHCNGLRQ